MREESPSRGRLVGRYVVHDRIAAGGMATVHVGRLLGAAGFSRTVAIKQLHEAYARDPDFVAMLLDEARLAASIRHPNVVPTLDVVAEDDQLLVVMEYVEGDSVAHLTKLTLAAKRRVPIAFAAAIVSQALHGLHAAHEARDKNGVPLGIVHRDVSPQNILVGIDGVSRVLDFGIAKAASRATTTEDGQLKGKTAYMAPEQLQHGAVDRRTDIFAASVVLWELLTGRRLFFADSPTAVMARVLTAPIEPPQKYAPEIPSALAAVALRGLERNPDARFATAEEMALAIEEALAPPRAKDVGAWVAMTSRVTLEARAQLVQIVEQSSHKMPVAAASGTDLARAIEEAERRRQHAEMATDVGSRGRGSASSGALPVPMLAPALAPGAVYVPLTSAPPGAPREESTGLATVQNTDHLPTTKPPPTSRAALALGIAGGASLLAALVVMLVTTRDMDKPARAEARSPVTPIESIASRVGPEMSGLPPLADAGVPKEPTKPPVWPPRPPAAPRTNPCEIPYTLDENHQKHFKPECIGN